MDQGNASAASRGRSGWDPLTIVVAIACVALSILVLLLARQNRALKAQLASLGVAAGQNDPAALKAGDVVAPFDTVSDRGERARVEFGGGAGRTLLLVFSPDCHACKDNMPIWNRLLATPVSPSIRVLGLRTTPGATADASEPHEALPVDVFSLASPIEKIPYVPATLLLDGEGRVVRAYFGVLGATQEAELQASLHG